LIPCVVCSESVDLCLMQASVTNMCLGHFHYKHSQSNLKIPLAVYLILPAQCSASRINITWPRPEIITCQISLQMNGYICITFLRLQPSMALPYRILIKTHHMTSRTKIQTITKAAKRLSCSVLLKVGDPPGIMLAEGEEVVEWMEVVRVCLCLFRYIRVSC